MLDILRLKSVIYVAAIQYLHAEKFIIIPLPGITNASGSCESVSNIFTLDESEFLTLSQTAQLQLEEYICTRNIEKIATTNRSYRKDNKNWEKFDGRHLNDFELLETEAKDKDLNWLLHHCEDLLKHIFIEVLNHANEIELSKFQEKNIVQHLQKGFHIVEYSQAIKDLKLKYGEDLTNFHEQKLILLYDRNLFVINYPEKIKFFNMKISDKYRSDWEKNAETTVDCVDVLLRYSGESIGGSVREYSQKIIENRLFNGIMFTQLQDLYQKKYKTSHIESAQMISKMFENYLNLFTNKTIHRAGMGLGFGRVAQFITCADNIVHF
ncbi:MAG: hypothetical protein RLY43_1318 [Bacteroidota bacterium]|jgi:aspartyl/asparaginyl-tRNA synthetase